MERFKRTISLLGEEEFKKLSNLKIAIIGLGGVGGFACEAVARLGIRNIIICDNDKVDITNINRQLIATSKTIELYKTDEFEKRIKEINPNCKIKKCTYFLDSFSISNIIDCDTDYVIDCIDSLRSKIEIYKYCLERNIKFISSMGTANKLNPQKLEITTLNKTSEDKLAKKMRYLAKQNCLDPKLINVVYSKEPAKTNISNPLPSYMLVPSVAGIYCVYSIINDLLK